MGKPIAFVGHQVQCPKCKGVFPIVEGAPVTTFYGKGVALAGMRTACGAILTCTLAAGLAVFLPSTAQAAATTGDVDSGVSKLKLNKGELFLRARVRIIASGWKPNHMHRNDNYEYTGAERQLAERGFLEVDSCSVDAAANCVLYYTRGSSCLRVDTVGEQVR